MTAAAPATAVIAAAGAGERLAAGAPKALVQLAGRPLVAWSIEAFAEAKTVDAIVVAAPPGDGGAFAPLAPPGGEFVVVAGGATRAESVVAALERVGSGLVAIHDAARPLVTPALIDDAIGRLAERPDADGVIAAAPIFDTVKRAQEARPERGEFGPGGPTVSKTESREYLWAAQTPQVFRTAKLHQVLGADPRRVAAATDEAVLVERAGGKVLIHPSPARNLKVTTPDDLRVAEALLAGG